MNRKADQKSNLVAVSANLFFVAIEYYSFIECTQARKTVAQKLETQFKKHSFRIYLNSINQTLS